MKKDLISQGKKLSFLLRHDTEYKFDEHGYRTVKDLVNNHGFTKEGLEEIVATNDKQRYEFDEWQRCHRSGDDGLRIPRL